MSIFKIAMGVKVKDSITGFSGIVTGRADYITGCRQYCVVPKATKDKASEGSWFDEDRLLESVKSLAEMRKPKNPGGPQQNPAPTK